MALLKNIQYPNGTASNYHKITDLRLNQIVAPTMLVIHDEGNGTPVETPKHYRLTVNVASYVSQNIREQDVANYLHSDVYRVNVTTEEIETTPIMTLAYNALKKTQTFAEAENV